MKINNTVILESEAATTNETTEKPNRKKRFTTVRAALVCLLVFTLICGIIYPIGVTLTAQTLFPYEANGSQITVTLADGTRKIYGSERNGQNYEEAKYLFGRVNTGAPTNLSPESEEFKTLVKERIAERKEKLAAAGYADTAEIPAELLTSGGSGVDPHISPDSAYFQIPALVKARAQSGETLTEDAVKAVIDKYTEGRFLWIFGEKRVNVLLVNLALDGLL